MAFRAEGRASERMRIRPVEGAGMSVMVIREGEGVVEYGRRRSLGRVEGRRRIGRRILGFVVVGVRGGGGAWENLGKLFMRCHQKIS